MMRQYRFWLVSVTTVMAFVLGGCSTMQERDREFKLEDSLNAYNNAIRWGSFEAATHHRVSRDDKKPYPPRLDLDALEGLKVVSYEIQRQAVDDTVSETRITAVIQFYRDDVGKVETLRDEQLWWYDEDKKRWFLDGDLPRFPLTLRPER